MQALVYMHTVDSCDGIVVYSPGSSPTPYISIVLQRLSCLLRIRFFLQQLRLLLMNEIVFLTHPAKTRHTLFADLY